MAEPREDQTPVSPDAGRPPPERQGFEWTPPAIVAALYTGGLLIPLLAIAGVIWAYASRGKASPWEQTVLRYEIRTFWIGVLYGLGFSLLATAVPPLVFVLYAAITVWYVVRLVKIWIACKDRRPMENPTTWLW